MTVVKCADGVAFYWQEVEMDRNRRLVAPLLGYTMYLACESYALMYGLKVLVAHPLIHPVAAILISQSSGFLIERFLDPKWMAKIDTQGWNQFQTPIARSLAYPLPVLAGILGRFYPWALFVSLAVFGLITFRLAWFVWIRPNAQEPYV